MASSAPPGNEDRRFRAVVEHSPDAVWMLDADAAILYANPPTGRVLGYTPQEIAGSNAFDFFLPSDRDAAHACVLRGGEPAPFRLRRKDGALIWVHAIAADYLADPDIQAIVLRLRDITQSRRAEQLLRQSEQRFRALIENSSDGFVLLDREGTVTYSGPAVLGYSHADVAGRSVLEHIHPDDLPDACAALAEVTTHPGKSLTSQYRARHADGSWRWVEATVKNLLGDPVVGGLVVNYRDITERRLYEEEIRGARDEIRHILESIQESFIALDREWRFTYVNRRVASVTGKSPAELIGRNMWDLFPEARNSDFYPHYQRVMTERVPEQFEMIYPATGRWLDVHAYPTEEGISAYILDITARKRSESFAAATHAVARILSESSTLDAMAPRVMRAIGEGLGLPVAVFWTVDRDAAVLRCAGSWRAAKTSPAFAPAGRDVVLRKGEGLPGQVWSDARPAWLSESFAVPLLCAGEVVAVLEFLSPQPRDRDPELLQLMDIVAAQIDNLLTRKLLESRYGPPSSCDRE